MIHYDRFFFSAQISSSIHQFASLRKDALRDQEYLARESRYLQSIAVADL